MTTLTHDQLIRLFRIMGELVGAFMDADYIQSTLPITVDDQQDQLVRDLTINVIPYDDQMISAYNNGMASSLTNRLDSPFDRKRAK